MKAEDQLVNRQSVARQPDESDYVLISLHIPKAAGTSFSEFLIAHFKDRLLMDYKHLPEHISPLKIRAITGYHYAINAFRRRSKIKCIHGHFLAAKYLSVRRAKFITWMRDPVERLASHYHYWKRIYTPESLPLHRRVIEEDWSLERFCLGPEIRNLYSLFLWRFPLDRFDFIGFTEYFEEDFLYFTNRFFGIAPPVPKSNINMDKRGIYVDDPDLRSKIEAYHARDMDLYRRALANRSQRQN